MKHGFDKLAKPYRWMEYLSFGGALQRCRTYFLPKLQDRKRALLLGDGDGRFTAALLRCAPALEAVAVDASPAMLRALQRRCGDDGRVTTVCADLGHGLPQHLRPRVDLIATHFFLDCLSDAEVRRVAEDVTECADAGALWVISEFQVPERGWMRLPSWLAVRSLYVAFGLLTGLRTRRLPAYGEVLRSHGWKMSDDRPRMGGLLVSQVWVFRGSF